MPQHLTIADAIFERYPETILGVVVAYGFDNHGSRPDILARLRAAEARVRCELARVVLIEHPAIAPWREAYRAFGAKPKDHPSSIENLLRRMQKGQDMPSINPLVDLYNAISLEFLVPAGGEDLDHVQGDIRLTFAGPNEPAVRLLGEAEARAPYPGEVIYTDDLGALCRRWNWKEADRTKLTPETRNAVLVLESVSEATALAVDSAARELSEAIADLLGGATTNLRLDAALRSIDL